MKVKIDVSAFFQKYADDEMEDTEKFKEVRDGVVSVLTSYIFAFETDVRYKVRKDSLDKFLVITQSLQNSENLDEFNGFWDCMYNWADANSVWIKT